METMTMTTMPTMTMRTKINKTLSHAAAAVLAAALLLCAAGTAQAQIKKVKPNPQAVELVNKFMAAITIEDEDQRLEAVLPLVHKSIKDPDGSDLDGATKPFQYKKAWQNARHYAMPVEISEVHDVGKRNVGYEETADSGRIEKYFAKKKKGVGGVPAPLLVFWPDDGGAPTILYMGNL